MPSSDTLVLSRAPCEALRPLVKRFMVVESGAARQDLHLPDTGLAMAFSWRGHCRIDGGLAVPPAAVTGICSGVRRHEHGPGHAVLIVAFTAAGAAAWLPQPLDTLAGTTTDLGDVLGHRAGLDRLQEQLADAADHDQRIRHLQNHLLKRADPTRVDPLVAAATAWIEQAQPAPRIALLCRHIGLSQSALERRFRRAVGVSPRRYASLVRLQAIVRLQATGTDLTGLAHAAGYCDQPHFIHDFKRFTGMAPGAFFARRHGD